MPESFTCHQCHRPQRIGRRRWTKYQPVYSEGPRWVGGWEDVCVCVRVCVYMSIPTGDCDCECKGFGVCMCRDYVVCGWVKNLDREECLLARWYTSPLVHSGMFVCPWDRDFHSVPRKQTGMFAMNNTRDYESSNRCTTDNVWSVIGPKPLLSASHSAFMVR